MDDKHLGQTLGRIKIDLSEFFQDERKFCFKCLDFDVLRRVGDLKNYLVKETGISENVTLTLANSALFDTDNIKVVRDGEQIRYKYL